MGIKILIITLVTFSINSYSADNLRLLIEKQSLEVNSLVNPKTTDMHLCSELGILQGLSSAYMAINSDKGQSLYLGESLSLYRSVCKTKKLSKVTREQIKELSGRIFKTFSAEIKKTADESSDLYN